jgi:hypothetical protein
MIAGQQQERVFRSQLNSTTRLAIGMMRLDRVKRVAMLPLSSVSTLRAQAAKEKAPKRQRRSINSGQATRFQRARATAAAHVVAAWRVIHSFNSPSPVTNVQPVYAATISAREDDADTMTVADRDSRVCGSMYHRRPHIPNYYTTKRYLLQRGV